MASATCILHHHAFTTISRSSSSSSQRPRPSIKPSRLVCRAQNKPLSNGNSDGDQAKGGVSRRLVLENLLVASAALGSALAAFVSPASGKQSWPELVGEKKEVAVATIEKENPYVKVVVLPANAPTDKMYNPARVRVWVDKNGVVLGEPSIPRTG
ncbi:hypothetical protein PTKIN_Ptkin01aG0388800 [Pterospermum kingtungense]